MNHFFSPSPLAWKNGLALIRIVTGILLVYHGWETFDGALMQKYTGWFSERNYPQPPFWAYAGKIAELLAGIGLILGLFTRLSCVAAVLAFTGIIFMLGDKGKIFQGDQHPFLFILLALVFFFTGPGNWALDNLFFKKRR